MPSGVNAGWSVVDSALPILTYRYSFGPGLANALAVGGTDGLIVVSPPSRAPSAAFEELAARGKVRALVAPNAFHHLGLPLWKARFPEAAVFAPAQSVARVEKQSKLSGIRPLAEAAPLCGPSLELVDMPHYKTGEVLVRMKTGAGPVWFVTDVIMNLPQVPPRFPFNLLFKWTGSAPGLCLNGVAPFFMVEDRRALRRWLREEVEKAPPFLLIACHGDPVDMDPPGKRLLEILPS
jgi:hypothetical protein